MKRKRLLLIQYSSYFTAIDYMFTKGLPLMHKDLKIAYPEMKKYLKEEFFQLDPIWPDKIELTWCHIGSVTLSFIAKNLETETTILERLQTIDPVIKELRKGKEENSPYTHVGFSVFFKGYMKFIQCAQAVKIFDKNIITIAGNVGALYKNTEKYVDYVCRSEGVIFLRKLLNENISKPIVPVFYEDKIPVNFGNSVLKLDTLFIVTKLGCINKCNFCPTNTLFQGKLISNFTTPENVYDAVISYRDKTKRKPDLLFCEPTALINKDWFYKLFKLFENETEDYIINIPTTISSLLKFDFDRISNSALRFGTINIGIESFTENYSKVVKHKYTKEILKKLCDYGIGPLLTYIIGFEHDTHETIWKDMKKLIDLESEVIRITNLHIFPGTALYDEYEERDRILEIIPDFLDLTGFQSFKHPHFKPGFEDILPLLCELYRYIEKEKGNVMTGNLEILKKLLILRKEKYGIKHNLYKDIFKKVKLYKNMVKGIFPSWKLYLKPTPKQIDKYRSLIDV